jgi:dienelactone hydrolase
MNALVTPVQVSVNNVTLEGDLGIPAGAHGVVLFAHGSGSSRHSPRNRYVARFLREAGFATLLLDLLTPDEAVVDKKTAHLRFDIDLLAGRLVSTTRWLAQDEQTASLPVGYFGASTGAAAALVAAPECAEHVAAVVSRGGRPDLAGAALRRVTAPTLLIIGSEDAFVLELNRRALDELAAREKEIAIVSGATHLFEEPGALEEVARLAADWFTVHLDHGLTVAG